ncbi:vascular endothelial growth factor Ab isoform X2 [Nerophis ophidion]|uniref:vascular endothelial growth factor Ab isoform X2 n=1 Tax=Nerophis ophidion TaxID=159077 RepID=UPI002ADFBA6C|nr:vascular endothelial growth factor Ab isoform X2 [Nerophis ophidion]
MNFIDSLTLLFLTLSAVKSANVPREAERGPHDVIPLMEVYNKSLCKPRELLVEILQEYPEEVEHIFIPSCVVLTRCAGCCNDETLQCTPTSSYNVTMEIKRIKTQRQQNDIFMSFTEHSACECRLKKEVKELKEKASVVQQSGVSDVVLYASSFSMGDKSGLQAGQCLQAVLGEKKAFVCAGPANLSLLVQTHGRVL